MSSTEYLSPDILFKSSFLIGYKNSLWLPKDYQWFTDVETPFNQISSVAFKNKLMKSNERMHYWPATHSSYKAESSSNHLSLQVEVFIYDFLDDSSKKAFWELKLHQSLSNAICCINLEINLRLNLELIV